MDALERAEFEVKTFGNPSKESGLKLIAEVARLRQLLSEADKREKVAREKALVDAIAAITDVPQFIKDETMADHGYLVRKTHRGDLIAAIRALQSEER